MYTNTKLALMPLLPTLCVCGKVDLRLNSCEMRYNPGDVRLNWTSKIFSVSPFCVVCVKREQTLLAGNSAGSHKAFPVLNSNLLVGFN